MSDKIFKVHDKLVHGVFSSAENAAALIRSALPAEMAARIDFATLEPRPTKHTGPHLEEGHSDLLYRAELDGQPVLIYVLVEHLSSCERFAVVRLLLYVLLTYHGICRDERPEGHLPPIIPLLLHHSEDGWTAATRFEEVIDPVALAVEGLSAHIPRFAFLLDDISAASDDELRLRRLPVQATLALWLLRDGRNPERFFAHLVAWAQSLEELASDAAGIGLLMSYIIEVLGADRANELRRQLAELAPTTERAMRTIAESIRESGKREGLEQGLEQGQRKIVEQLLTTKFGDLPESVLARLSAATPEELEQLAKRVLDANELSDVFGG